MTSSPSRGTVSSSTPLSSRSLLSRLKSPLQSKARNFADFYIQPDDPHRQYAPGDIISGSVIIKVLKPLRITHLVISLHGYAQVFKNPNSPGDAYKNYSATVGLGKGKKAGSYFGNGFASLFEDEVVLCGEGRLGEGVYHFNFELDFPSKGLPSSIDFERGTVSYMLTSTLTRPTTISPTSSCDTKVYLMDVIDVAPIPEPKPRVISLEPISRRSRAKPARKRPAATETKEAAQQGPENAEGSRSGRVLELHSVTEESDGLGSPAPSDVSFESQMSSGNASGTEYGIRSVNTTHVADASIQNGSRTTFKGKTITATIDVLKGGVLRGEHIPVKISVNHTKHVRSLKGIIITLYRQARVDMHPALPVLPNSKGDKTKSEDYYPKSRTGLGGLSLSSAGSSHLFRKDLSQSFAPLFVDPRTLTAEVKCSVRVPDDAFPTISNVPGAMISFKYFIEVVVDIQGKLTGLDRMVANAGLVSVPTASMTGSGTGGSDSASMFATWGPNIVDTDGIRREKGVVSCLFEVVIGTKDSERNGKRRQHPQEQSFEQPGVHDIALDPNNNNAYMGDGSEQEYYGYDENGQYYDQYGYDSTYYDAPGYQQDTNSASQPPYQHSPNPLEDEEGISEKERIRRAEARLLPSQPPGAAGSSSPPSTLPGIPPSAPMLPEDDDPNPPYSPPEASSATASTSHPPPPFPTAAPSTAASMSHSPNAPLMQRRTTALTDDDSRTATNGSSLTINASTQQSHGPNVSSSSNQQNGNKALPRMPSQSMSTERAPDYFPSSSSHVQPTDDKQELQRRRLEMERSAPPTEDHDDVPSQEPSAPPTSAMQNLALAPSAPMLDDEDEGLVDAVRPGPSGSNPHSGRRVSEALPEYHR